MSPHEVKEQKLTATFKALIKLLKSKRFEDISITELTRTAGVSRTYYYRNFKTLDDVISAYEMLRIIQYLRQLPNNPAKLTFETMMTHYFQLVADDADDQLTLISAGKEQVIIKAFNTSYHYLQKDNVEQIDEYDYDFLSGAVVNVSIHWLKNGMVESAELMGKKIRQFL